MTVNTLMPQFDTERITTQRDVMAKRIEELAQPMTHDEYGILHAPSFVASQRGRYDTDQIALRKPTSASTSVGSAEPKTSLIQKVKNLFKKSKEKNVHTSAAIARAESSGASDPLEFIETLAKWGAVLLLLYLLYRYVIKPMMHKKADDTQDKGASHAAPSTSRADFYDPLEEHVIQSLH